MKEIAVVNEVTIIKLKHIVYSFVSISQCKKVKTIYSNKFYK